MGNKKEKTRRKMLARKRKDSRVAVERKGRRKGNCRSKASAIICRKSKNTGEPARNYNAER